MKINYKKIYENAAKAGGWSVFKKDTDAVWGDIYENLSKNLKGIESVLDIGTAEGNKFLRIAPKIKVGIGIDTEPEMIRLAKKNGEKFKNISFKVMNSDRLKFPKESFNIIISRHAHVNFKEAFRVLKPKGRVIMQQVHETDKSNLKEAFGRGQGFGVSFNKRLLKRYTKEGQKAGFMVIKASVSDRSYFFKNKKKLISFLKITPTIPNFGSKKDYKVLENFIRDNKTKRGIKSNVARFFLELKK